jgi:septal ring factor EnvC (AmiA/AmiB activator)
LNPRLCSLMVRKWSTVPISLSYTTPGLRLTHPWLRLTHPCLRLTHLAAVNTPLGCGEQAAEDRARIATMGEDRDQLREALTETRKQLEDMEAERARIGSQLRHLDEQNTHTEAQLGRSLAEVRLPTRSSSKRGVTRRLPNRSERVKWLSCGTLRLKMS